MIETYISEKNYNCTDILQSTNIFQKPFKWLSNFMKYSIIYYIWLHCPISILYEEFHSCDFTKKTSRWGFSFKQMQVCEYNFFFEKSLLFER